MMVNLLLYSISIYLFSIFYLDTSNSFKFRRNRSSGTSHTASDYDNSSSSIFNDNDYQQDRLSLVETSSQRKHPIKQATSPETIIHV